MQVNQIKYKEIAESYFIIIIIYLFGFCYKTIKLLKIM